MGFLKSRVAAKMGPLSSDTMVLCLPGEAILTDKLVQGQRIKVMDSQGSTLLRPFSIGEK